MEAFKQPNHKRDLKWLQIAHDLKSPLTALEIVAARLKTLPPDERQLILQAVGRIQEIVIDVLKPQPVRSVPSLRMIGVPWEPALLRSLLNEKRIEFPNVFYRLEITACGPVTEHIPAAMMNRILSNLLNNAAEANGGQGEVSVRVYSNITYCIEIEDQGPGISDDVRLTLGQLGVSGKGGDGGLRGLGLYSAFQFSKQQGGQLTIEDKNVLRGTTIRLDFINRGPYKSHGYRAPRNHPRVESAP